MRLGMLARAEESELTFLNGLGLRCFQWVRFGQHPSATLGSDWQSEAERARALWSGLGLRCSAIAAYYANPLDPAQTEAACRILTRAIDVAALLGIPVVSAFPGAVINPVINQRGGNPVYQSSTNDIPRILEFWGPLALKADQSGVHIAFEHCPQGLHHLSVMGYNFFGQPALWEAFFDACPHANIGIEWDAAHLICQGIDPLENLRMFGRKIFHVHAKDAWVDHSLMRKYGICHAGVAEHRFPGLGQSDWAQILHLLVRSGYTHDLNIEGWHDPVYRDHPGGLQLETTGLLIARKTLEPLLIPEA